MKSNKVINNIIILILSLIPLMSYANVEKISTTGYYAMGDSDSKIDGYKMALEDAKLKASEKAMSYIDSETSIKNGKLKEKIKVISSSVLKVNILDKNYKYKNNTMIVSVRINSTVDTSSLLEKIKLLNNNKETDTLISKLELENSILHGQLKSITNKLSKKIDALNSNQIYELEKQRDNALLSLGENITKVKKVFKKGSLMSIAKRGSLKNDLAINDIKLNFIEKIKGSKDTVKVGEIEIEENGNNYNASIPINWNFSKTTIQVLKNNLTSIHNYKGAVEIKGYNNTKDKRKSIISENSYNYLKNLKGYIEVSIGKYKEKVYFLSPVVCHVSCSAGRRGKKNAFKYLQNSNEVNKLFYNKRNPVVIRNIDKNTIEESSSVGIKIIIEKT